MRELPSAYRQRRLSTRQQLAYAHVDEHASRRREAWQLLSAQLEAVGVSEAAYAYALANLQRDARVAVHFHPERLTRSGHSVAAGLLRDGVYKNQYLTGVSGGSPTAFAGGERDLWERAMFGEAYADIAFAAERPAYGALMVVPHPDGPGPRFGSCYFVLRPEVSQRCTFTWGGTNEDDALSRSGTLQSFAPVMSALLDQLERAPGALGVMGLTGPQAIEHLGSPRMQARLDKLGNVLDSFIEVQIHGTLDLRSDVAGLVADPAFADAEIGSLLQRLCARYGFELAWHPGYVLAVDDVPEQFRDYVIGPLARRIARTGIIDAASIGSAANAFHVAPADWAELMVHENALATFRRLWHVLVERGVPARTAPNVRP